MSNGNNVKRESGLAALLQVLVVAAVVGGAVFGWWKVSAEKKRVADLAVNAKQATEGDDSPSLLKAQKLFEDIDPSGATQEKDPSILAAMAELQAQLYFTYGIADAKTRAEKYVSMAKDRDLKKAERYAAEAYLLLGDGRAAEAEAMLTDLVNNRGARHAKLLHALAVAKLVQGKAKDAVVAAQEGQKLSTQLVRLPIAEGDAFLAQGNFSGAEGGYLKAMKLNGDHLRARTALAMVAASARKAKPAQLAQSLDDLLGFAEAKHKQIGQPVPPRVKGFIEYAKGEILLVDNKAAEALQQADASLTTDPGQAATLGLKGRALAKLGKVAEAKAAFDQALSAAPSSLPIAVAAAKTLRRAGAQADGLAYLQKVVATNPENGLGHAELSLFLSAAGQSKDALKEADEAVAKLGNAHDLAVFAKARAQHADKDLVKALDTYKEALGTHGNPEWAELYFALGQLRFDEKNWEEADSAFDSAIKFWDKQGGSLDDIADAWEMKARALGSMKGKTKESKEAQQKADDLRAGKAG
jgi:tetratricopeptide (TPR) repeat protein